MKTYIIKISQEICYTSEVKANSEEEAREMCADDIDQGDYNLVVEETIDRQEVIESKEVEEWTYKKKLNLLEKNYIKR